MTGKPFAKLVPKRDRNLLFGETGSVSIIDALRAAAGQPDLSGLRKDGSEFPLELEFHPVNEAEHPFGPAVQIRLLDITQRRQIDLEERRHEQDLLDKRRELERSNADLEEFCYAVSHDLKAPLRAIGHLAQWIGEDIGTAAPPDTLTNIELLQSRVVRMQELLEGLLAYSSVAKTEKSVELLDIAEVIDNVVAMLAPPPRFTIRCVGPMLLIRTERAAIQMVLENLIGNGLKHHDRSEGLIEISMQPFDGLLEFRVSDDGPGIASQFHQRIFTIFQTLKTRDEFEASGIGLAIVKRKVEGHGGLIWVESAPPIRGTTFVFTWKESMP
jgi:light-regulated signal transduction histidine kinase (bacteriophytochrome)